ncbi:MAG: hypothetical protein J0M34_00805 [Alphaproteobacteria bacterium]|nr:hypothetical protein [Alphaproteobacteria bacterium]
MAELKEHEVKTKAIHRDPAFARPDASVLISTALFALVGAFIGRQVGKFGEMNSDMGYRGLSSLLGMVLGGVFFGGVASYSSMRAQVKEKMKSEQGRIPIDADFSAPHVTHSPHTRAQHVEHQGPVKTASLDKAV